MAQYYFDVNDEELGANLPSFLRLTTNSTSAIENNIEERERPEGNIGKVWRYDPKINNTGYGLILHAVPKQAGTKEVLLLCKLSTNSSNNYLILRPAPRLDEITANKPDWIHAGLRPGDSQVRVRSEVNGVLSSHATSEKTGWNYDFASTHWFWQRTRITAEGVVSAKVWEHGTAEPADWDLQYTDSSNRLEESYLGLSSRNSVEMLVAKVSAATEGDSAPTEPVDGSVSQAINSTGIASVEAFGQLAIVPGPASLFAHTIESAELFGSPEFMAGPVSILVSGIPSEETVSELTIYAGGSAIFADSIDSAEQFGFVSFVPGAMSISAVSIEPESIVYSPEIIAGPAVIYAESVPGAELFSDMSLFNVQQLIKLVGISTAEVFGSTIMQGGADLSGWLTGRLNIKPALTALVGVNRVH